MPNGQRQARWKWNAVNIGWIVSRFVDFECPRDDNFGDIGRRSGEPPAGYLFYSLDLLNNLAEVRNQRLERCHICVKMLRGAFFK